MNDLIINNLFEFWTLIGHKTKRLNETSDYKTVSMLNSDWPNRVFSITNKQHVLNNILSLSMAGEIPEIITLQKPNKLADNPNTSFLFRQKNMALDLSEKSLKPVLNGNIRQVIIEEDAISFAKTASESFRYQVALNVVSTLCEADSRVKMFNYYKDNECLGCGIVFFDSNNIAGLHMIGTIPEGRNQGIGKSMTEKLLAEAILTGSEKCVLHASLMGEAIYRKLGFIAYGEIETYRILKKQSN